MDLSLVYWLNYRFYNSAYSILYILILFLSLGWRIAYIDIETLMSLVGRSVGWSFWCVSVCCVPFKWYSFPFDFVRSSFLRLLFVLVRSLHYTRRSRALTIIWCLPLFSLVVIFVRLGRTIRCAGRVDVSKLNTIVECPVSIPLHFSFILSSNNDTTTTNDWSSLESSAIFSLDNLASPSYEWVVCTSESMIKEKRTLQLNRQ